MFIFGEKMIYPKSPRKENPKLLKLARGKPCLMQVAFDCYGVDGSTTVAAHSNELRHGKGKAMKAHDHYSVWACVNCHRWYDESGAGKAEKQKAFEVAHNRQIKEWGKLIGKSKKSSGAAEWALTELFDVAVKDFIKATA